MTMHRIEFGFNVSHTIPFPEEVAFAQTHGFSCLQLWYDSRGFSVHNTEPDDIQPFQTCEIPLLVHAALDVNEFETHLDILSEYLSDLQLTEVIIHPVSRGNITRTEAMERLCYWAEQGVQRFNAQGITLFLENNSKLECVLQTIQEIQQVFTHAPQAELLLDVAHMDDYEHLRQTLEVKYPRILHVADRHLEHVHEHLPLGDGNIDFELVFGTFLKDFTGKIIFEVPFEFDARLRSKQRLEQVLQASYER